METLKYSDILKQNAALRLANKEHKPYRIKVLSNITCNQLKEVLSYVLYTEHVNPVISFGNYDNIIQESFHCAGEDMVVVHYDLMNILDKYPTFVESFDEQELNAVQETIQSEVDLILSNTAGVPSLVFNTFSSKGIHVNALLSPKCKKLEVSLNEYLQSWPNTNLNVLDINDVIAELGVKSSFDFKLYILSKTLYTIDFWKAYSMSLLPLLLRNSGKARKAIIFDCDNTLWKGILGEDGEAGIDLSPQTKIGKIFNKVQQIAVWLSRQGILVGLCSKNNPADVERVLENHDDMLLRKDDIVVSRVNWEDKASNLRSIAAELNIGLDSLVFVDDSPFEINLIREQLPEVHCLQVPEAIHDYPGALLKTISRYFYLTGSSADLEKKDQYKVQALRNDLKNKFSSMDDYLASIQLEITVVLDDSAMLGRISELTQKTNQFNLTTKRYTEVQMEAFMKNEGTTVFSVSVRDKFGDSGLTAVCVVEFDGVAIVDTFLMSCRVMGRNIEKAIMDVVMREAADRGCAKVFAKYVRTQKNESIQEFYDDLGFKCIQSENEVKVYELETRAYVYNNLSYIHINN